MGFVVTVIAQHLHQPRLANTCLRAEQDHLPVTGLGPLPPPQEQLHFFFSADE